MKSLRKVSASKYPALPPITPVGVRIATPPPGASTEARCKSCLPGHPPAKVTPSTGQEKDG